MTILLKAGLVGSISWIVNYAILLLLKKTTKLIYNVRIMISTFLGCIISFFGHKYITYSNIVNILTIKQMVIFIFAELLLSFCYTTLSIYIYKKVINNNYIKKKVKNKILKSNYFKNIIVYSILIILFLVGSLPLYKLIYKL